MQNFEEKYPNNGLNTDDENRFIAPDESRFILNLRAGSSESDNIGAIENIKGNIEVTVELPSGRNKCIGSEGDQTTHSNFFFVWNENGYHTIYRYVHNENQVRILSQDDPANPFLNFKEYDLINDIDVVEDLLYFRSDENPPKKINFVKADNDSEDTNQVWNWYLGTKYIEGKTTLELEISVRDSAYNSTPSSFPTTTLTIDSSLDKKEIAKDLATQLNTLSFPFIASSCGEFVSIENTSTDFYEIVATDNGLNTSQVVPQNFYNSYNDRIVDVIKHPPHCPITASVESDDTFSRNYIGEKVFQFATRFVYDDDEKSTVSPYSLNIYNNRGCVDVVSDTQNNYISIDFSALEELNRVEDLQAIKKIELFVKEGQFGLWKSIKVLEQYQFVDISDRGYDFYNDGIYSSVDQDAFDTPFSSVPQLTKNQELAKERLFYANNLEGFDNTCIDASIDVSYTDVSSQVSPAKHSISGFIFIRNAWDQINRSRPIWKNSNGDTVWGGLGLKVNTSQKLPLGGFVVYLTGTDKKTISRQATIGGFLPQDAEGVITDPGGNPLNYNQKLRQVAENTSNGFNSATYSTFTISDVPDGWYTLRVASTETTQEQLDSGSLDYQNTSTNVFRMGRFSSITPPTLLTGGYASESQGKTELLVHVNGGDVSLIGIDILDLSNENSIIGGDDIITGYVVDNDIPYTSPNITYDFALKDTRVSSALLSFNKQANSTWGNLAFPFGSAWTDHNGYYFYGLNEGELGNSLQITGIRSGIIQAVDYDFNNAYKVQRVGLYTDTSPGPREVAIRLKKGATEPIRTKVTGKIEDLFGQGIANASVVAIRSYRVDTDANGDYSFWHYGIIAATITNIGTFDTLLTVTSKNITCGASYSSLYDFNFDYSAWGNAILAGTTPTQPLNATNNYPTLIIDVPALVGDTSLSSVINAMKRGWDGKIGIVYYDRGLRSGAVNTNRDLELHIPFYSEKDSDGQIKSGVPVLDWQIKHTPPSWATHWQWLRTRNTKVGSYFQWTTPLTAYATYDPNATVGYTIATFSTGNRLGLSIENYIKYQTNNPKVDLQVDINKETTRVRFIKDENGNTFSTYADVKVLDVAVIGTIGTFVVVENDASIGQINAGTLIEIYNEVLDIEEDIYYEMGECFEVGTDSDGNKYHKGLDQDQDPLDPFNVPATGTLRSGDAYYRFRNIPDITVNNNPFIDDDGVSDFYKSEVESIGRPNAENSDAAQLWKPNQIRHSGKYIPDSKVNGLSLFESVNFTNLPISYGDINKLQLVANVLLSIHEFRWVSNYIGEAVIRKQDGSDDLVASSKVFGDFRASKFIAGTVNPESIVEYKGIVFGYDLNKGLMVQYAADGLTDIGAYKMTNYFSDKGQKILSYSKDSVNPIKIMAGYDTKNNEYIITFPSILVPNTITVDEGLDSSRISPTKEVMTSETISFSPKINKWITFYSYKPEMYSSLDINMLTFLDGKLWLHNENPIYNNFYGVQYPSQVEILFADKPQQVKVYRSVGVESYHAWGVPYAKTPNGMETVVSPLRFVRREDSFFAPMMRDKNTVGFTDEFEAILNGREMRDRTIKVLLENTETELVTLFNASMISTLSSRHQK
jgi:hypothetical protein